MQLGPILDRELMSLARRRGSYSGRVAVPFLMLAVLWINHWAWNYVREGELTVQDMAYFGRLTFAQFALAQVLATLYIVPGYVDRSIGEEKDRKTLGFLLTTQLSSGAIILGKLAASLLQYLACLCTGLPVVLLLPLFGGVQPEVVLWAYAGTLSSALFVAGLSALNAVLVPGGREAHRLTSTLVAGWLLGPLVLDLFLLRLPPAITMWAQPLNELILASSPTVVLARMLRFFSAFSLQDDLLRMIAIQLACATIFILIAIAQLRPAWRRNEGGGPVRKTRKQPLVRVRARPDCGERPVLWKELHTGRNRGASWLLTTLGWWMMVAFVGFLLFLGGVHRAAQEVMDYGYGSMPASPTGPALNLNLMLRVLTVFLSFLYGLVVTGVACDGIVIERIRETWLGLIATPIESRQILHAKMFGAFWRAKRLALLLLGLWSIGLLVGAIHPLGYLAAVLGLIVSTWFFTAAGTYASLRSKSREAAQTLALSPVLVLSLTGFLPKALPEGARSVLTGAASIPLVETMLLWSYREMDAGMNSSPSPTLEMLGFHTNEGTLAVVVACALGLIVTTLAAALLTRLADRQFDRLVGRPWRRPLDDQSSRPHPTERPSLAAESST